MRIVVCYKNVPDEQDIIVKADRTLDLSAAPWKIGQYDLNAVEAGVALAEELGGSEVIALTAAGEAVDNSKLRKGILSRGPDKLVQIKGACLERADCYAVAGTLAKAIQAMGEVDLVLFGEGSGDVYAQQTGCMTGAILGWPTLNFIRQVAVEGSVLLVSRDLEDAQETLRVELPAVLSVTSDINTPRIASMKAILAAGSKPVSIWSLNDIGAGGEEKTSIVSIEAPEKAQRKQSILEDDSPENIEAFAQHLRRLIW